MAFLATISWLFCYSLTREKRVFSVFNVADATVFHILSFPLLSLSRTIFNPKHYFIPTPSFSSKFFANPFKVCISYTILIFYFWIMQNLCLGFWKLGIFKNWVGFLFQLNFFLKSLIGLFPICYLCICVGPLWQFDHVLRYFSICSCIFHNCCALLHVMCSTNYLGDSYVLFWTQLSSNLWCWSCLIIWIIFW